MLHALHSLDRLLRGEATRPESLRDGIIDIPARGLCFVVLVLAMIYGACMGTYSLFRVGDPNVPQVGPPARSSSPGPSMPPAREAASLSSR